MDSSIGISLNLSNMAPAQFMDCGFNSFCRMGDTILGACDEGIYEVESGGDDDGADIDAYFVFPKTDLAIRHLKRIIRIYAGLETDGELICDLEADDSDAGSCDLSYGSSALPQKTAEGTPPMSHKGTYWSIAIRNTNGCDFSIDSIAVDIITLGRNPSGR